MRLLRKYIGIDIGKQSFPLALCIEPHIFGEKGLLIGAESHLVQHRTYLLVPLSLQLKLGCQGLLVIIRKHNIQQEG